MTDDLRNDLMVIILEEAFQMLESYARKVVTGNGGLARFNHADREARDAADHILQRIESRCSRIEG